MAGSIDRLATILPDPGPEDEPVIRKTVPVNARKAYNTDVAGNGATPGESEARTCDASLTDELPQEQGNGLAEEVVEHLYRRIAELEKENAELREKLAESIHPLDDAVCFQVFNAFEELYGRKPPYPAPVRPFSEINTLIEEMVKSFATAIDSRRRMAQITEAQLMAMFIHLGALLPFDYIQVLDKFGPDRNNERVLVKEFIRWFGRHGIELLTLEKARERVRELRQAARRAADDRTG